LASTVVADAASVASVLTMDVIAVLYSSFKVCRKQICFLIFDLKICSKKISFTATHCFNHSDSSDSS